MCLTQVTTRDQAIVKLSAEVDSLQQKHTSAVEEVHYVVIVLSIESHCNVENVNSDRNRTRLSSIYCLPTIERAYNSIMLLT